MIYLFLIDSQIYILSGYFFDWEKGFSQTATSTLNWIEIKNWNFLVKHTPVSFYLHLQDLRRFAVMYESDFIPGAYF